MGPPEVVAATFEAGPGPASVLANQLVWVTEAISHEVMAGTSTANAAATATEWIGGGGLASAQSALGLNTGLHTLVGWITHKVAVTQAAADAFALAASTVIPALISQTNRDETVVLHSTNFMGVNTPAIIERDVEYFGEHWPHNSSVGLSYSSLLTGLIGTLGVPPPLAPMGASPAAPAVAGTVAAQSAARAAQGGLTSSMEAAEAPANAASSTGGEMGSLLQQGPQLLSAMTDPLKSFASAPTQALQGFASAPQSLMGMFSAMRATDAIGANAALTNAVSEPLRAGTGVVTGAGPGVSGVGGYPGATLTSYTRPSSTFSPESAGRPTGRAGVLNAAELRGPTTSGMGGTPMPMSPATGMLNRGNNTGDTGEQNEAIRARIVVGSELPDPSAEGRPA